MKHVFDAISALEESALLALDIARDETQPSGVRVGAIGAATRASSAAIAARQMMSRIEQENLLWARRTQERAAMLGVQSEADQIALDRATTLLAPAETDPDPEPQQEVPAW